MGLYLLVIIIPLLKINSLKIIDLFPIKQVLYRRCSLGASYFGKMLGRDLPKAQGVPSIRRVSSLLAAKQHFKLTARSANHWQKLSIQTQNLLWKNMYVTNCYGSCILVQKCHPKSIRIYLALLSLARPLKSVVFLYVRNLGLVHRELVLHSSQGFELLTSSRIGFAWFRIVFALMWTDSSICCGSFLEASERRSIKETIAVLEERWSGWFVSFKASISALPISMGTLQI